MNRLLNRKTETKYIGQYTTCATGLQTGVSPFNPGAWENAIQPLGSHSSGQYWTVALPAMTQGVSDINRIGDRIEPVSHRVKMTVRFAQEYIPNPEGGGGTLQAQDNPLDVTVYVFYGLIKAMKTYTQPSQLSYVDKSIVVSGQTEATRAMTHLLDDGDLTFSTFTGDPILAQQPLSEYVNMKVKKIHLRRGAGYINTNAGNGGAEANTDSQNTISKTFSLKFRCPTKLSYASSTDLYPDNYAPVFAVGYVFNDATASGNTASPAFPGGQVEYVAQSQLWFKDHQ